MLKEFKEFAIKGNMIDMAVGIIIGAAFGKVVTSLVSDVILPPLGLLINNVDFANLFLNLSNQPVASLEEAKKAGVATLNYGLFINHAIDFLLVSFAVFLLVKQVNRLRKAPPPAPPNTKECPFCVQPIALLAKRCSHCTSNL